MAIDGEDEISEFYSRRKGFFRTYLWCSIGTANELKDAVSWRLTFIFAPLKSSPTGGTRPIWVSVWDRIDSKSAFVIHSLSRAIPEGINSWKDGFINDVAVYKYKPGLYEAQTSFTTLYNCFNSPTGSIKHTLYDVGLRNLAQLHPGSGFQRLQEIDKLCPIDFSIAVHVAHREEKLAFFFGRSWKQRFFLL